jgi:hypothetical protein
MCFRLSLAFTLELIARDIGLDGNVKQPPNCPDAAHP